MTFSITLIGGPTALIEIDGFRLLTDPTFDAPGAYQLPHVKLEKLVGPAVTRGRRSAKSMPCCSATTSIPTISIIPAATFSKSAKRVLTTEAGAKRLGGKAEGFAPWAVTELTGRDGRSLTITATPARHGPAGIEPLSGDVIGFVRDARTNQAAARSISAATPSGSTASPRSRGASRPAWCCRSRARRRPAGPSISPWTPTTRSRPRARFADAVIVPVHTDGWAHFSQNAERSARHLRHARLRTAPADSGAGCRDRDRAVALVRGVLAQVPRSGTESCPVRCRGGWTRAWQIATSRIQNSHAHRDAGNKSRRRRPSRISRFASAIFCKGARPRPDHRRVRRRSVRDRHLQPGRRATRLRHRLDHAADLSADGGDPGNLRPGRPRHRARHIRQCVPALSGCAAQRRGGAAVHRQHHQHRGRSRRHGGCHQAADRRPRHRLCRVLWRDLGRGADLPRLQALCRGAEMADAQPVRLCRRACLCEGVVGRGADRHPGAAGSPGAPIISPPSSRFSAPRSRPICSSGRPRRRPRTSASTRQSGR